MYVLLKLNPVLSECNVADDDTYSSNASISPELSPPICTTPLPVNLVTVESKENKSTQGIQILYVVQGL